MNQTCISLITWDCVESPLIVTSLVNSNRCIFAIIHEFPAFIPYFLVFGRRSEKISFFISIELLLICTNPVIYWLEKYIVYVYWVYIYIWNISKFYEYLISRIIWTPKPKQQIKPTHMSSTLYTKTTISFSNS